MSLTTYNRTQTVRIPKISINGNDIREYLIGFNIYEDIFSHFMTCDINILDHRSLTENIPILGGETITITFQSHPVTGDFPEITKEFICTAITNLDVDLNQLGQKGRVYTIKGISIPAYENLQKRMCRAYENLTEDDIVSDVCNNVLGIDNLRTESCKLTRTVVVPNLRPSEFISLLSKSAIRSSTDRIADYVFYEDFDKFNFVPLDFLVEQSPVQTITNKITRHVTNQEYTLLNAAYFDNSKNFDLVENMINGMYSSTAYSVNLNEKKYEEKLFKYTEFFGQQADIDGSNIMLMDNPPDFPRQTISLHPNENSLEVYSKEREDWNGVRKKLFQQFKNNKYTCDIDGDTNIKVGDVITFDLPSYDSTDDTGDSVSQKLDKFLSGNYLIIHLRHYVSKKEHRMVLTLAKNKRKSE